MENFELISIIVGVAGAALALITLVVAIMNLYFLKKWSTDDWKREKRLPFYRSLNVYLDELIATFIGGKLGVYRTPDFSDYMKDATMLGLSDVANELLDMHLLIRQAEQLEGDDDKEGAKKVVDNFCARLSTLRGKLQYDMTSLTNDRKN